MSWIVTKDGRPRTPRLDGEFEILAAFHRLQGQSMEWAIKYEGWQVVEVPDDVWHPVEQREMTSMARALFTDHGHDLADEDFIKESCGACALNGYGEHDDGGAVKLAPNYGGWARVYVQAGEPIPARWVEAFLAEINDPNRSYAECLRRDIATFGVLGGSVQQAIANL